MASMADEAKGGRPGAGGLTAVDAGLYAVTVFAWSTSWFAMKLQAVGGVAADVSVVWRFLISASLMLGWVVVSHRPLRFALRDHLRFAAMGVAMFSSNFFLYYIGSHSLPSGLLSVVFSLASVFNLVLGALLLGQKISAGVALGAVVGSTGIALIFWPEIAGTEFNHDALIALCLCIGGTLLFCLGNMISSTLQRRGISVISASAWSMAYGAAFMATVALIRGSRFELPLDAVYLGSLGWLSVVSTVIAFACYLTLLGRIGSARAGYSAVVFPVFALMISTVAEGYVWTPLAVAGLGAVMLGNIIVLTRRR
ncbi:DMT family transporter [Methylobrevis albus]|nr:DMT family transporter [Methylobrevis albus]